MKFITEKFGGSSTARNETLFTCANGNIGFRGDTEENDGSVHKGMYINGLYDTEPIKYGETAYGYAKDHQTILNLPDPKSIELKVDGHMFGTSGKSGSVTQFRLELDEEAGLMTRDTAWNYHGKSAVVVHSERLVSFAHESCAAIRYTVTNSSDCTEHIELTSAIDTRARNILAEDDPRIGAKFTHTPLVIDTVQSADGTLSFSAHTANSGLYLAGTVMHTIEETGKPQRWDEYSAAGEVPSCTADITLAAGGSLTVTKYICYCWSHSAETIAANSSRECASFSRAGFVAAAREQRAYLSRFWNTANITIEGDRDSEEALRFNLFHLLQSAGKNGKVSIAAKGLTSEGYEGHFFWDTESYVCPVFTYTAPEVARKLLEYRASILSAAENRAQVMSLKGALYPWRTIGGEEASAYYPAGTAQYHIDADIMFALNRYLNAHGGDTGFDEEAVQKMAAETARMYVSLGSYEAHKGGAFCINDVTGPDEYTAIVNNNAFTNLMARENLEISCARAGDEASAGEKAEWKRAADAMYIPFDKKTGVYPQDDSFMDKADWDFAHTPKENYPLLLHYHPLVIYRHRVLKQPDLVLAQFLLSARFTRAEKIRNFYFYEPYTTGDSSLSHCIQSIMAAECGDTEKALNYFSKTVRMDIDDVNGNSRDGIHTACMAGSWMSVVYGFAGFRDYGGTYSFNPCIPDGWKKLSFSLAIRGVVLDVTVTDSEAVYLLRTPVKSGATLTVIHRDTSFTLSAEHQSQTFSLQPKLGAVLFDLDGVITDTAPLHYRAWKKIADENGLRFDEAMNRMLLGISREASLDIILRENTVTWADEKKAAVCAEKNEIYKQMLTTLTAADILPGITKLLADLRTHGVKIALASSSKNAFAVLKSLGIDTLFDAVADASRVQMAKPEPDIFLAAAEQAGVWYADCVGVEDAAAGIASIQKAGMKAVGVKADGTLTAADLIVDGTAELTYEKIYAVQCG